MNVHLRKTTDNQFNRGIIVEQAENVGDVYEGEPADENLGIFRFELQMCEHGGQDWEKLYDFYELITFEDLREQAGLEVPAKYRLLARRFGNKDQVVWSNFIPTINQLKLLRDKQLMVKHSKKGNPFLAKAKLERKKRSMLSRFHIKRLKKGHKKSAQKYAVDGTFDKMIKRTLNRGRLMKGKTVRQTKESRTIELAEEGKANIVKVDKVEKKVEQQKPKKVKPRYIRGFNVDALRSFNKKRE